MKVNYLLFIFGAAGMQILPPAISTATSSDAVSFDLALAQQTLFVTKDIADTVDIGGLILDAPSGQQYASTFAQDLTDLTQQNWTVNVIEQIPQNVSGIYLTKYAGDVSSLTYENGEATEEGYALDVTSTQIIISGVGARGTFWGTRTVLQQLLLHNLTSIPAMHAKDAPAYATRGYMLDAGRKWYSPFFLQDLCTYASFFKMSEFHYHVSDNYPLNRGRNETWQNVYSQFSLRPEDPELLAGLIERENETLSRQDYADLEQHCAAYGIAVIPEIEAPGHCLTITKWKPELALEKKDLLNLSHPESIPTVKRIWDEFLPWFNVKEVHIGADEYDASLADVYINFVNTMAEHISITANKSVRAWGTPFDPPTEDIRINPDVAIQHWQYGQSDPIQLERDGHQIINSQDWWAYVSIKNDHMPILPARYPQLFNNTRILNFADQPDWQWDPHLFNQVNTSEGYQLSPTSKSNKGAIMASWNDNGPDASTQLEAYYIWRKGIPLVAARAWSGSRGPRVDASTIDATIDFLSRHAPSQNLERTIPPPAAGVAERAAPLFTWTAGDDDAALSSSPAPLSIGSKGMNHTLHLRARGAFNLSSPDTTLRLGDDGTLSYIADGWTYPLRAVAESDGFDPGHPGRIWSNASSSSHEQVVIEMGDGGREIDVTITTTAVDGSRVWIDGVWSGRFEVFVFGGRNTLFSWSQMAFVAPLDAVEGALVALEVYDGVRDVADLQGRENGGAGAVSRKVSSGAGHAVSWGMSMLMQFVISLACVIYVLA
jgi:hexosaminidase